MCGSCQEFAPKWDELEKSVKSIVTGKIDIDSKEGMQLAKRLGVLDQGIPNVQLYYSKNKPGISILAGKIFSIFVHS